MTAHDTAGIVRAYHDARARKDYTGARTLLAATLTVEVPVNDYPTAESFAAALDEFRAHGEQRRIAGGDERRQRGDAAV